MQAHELDMFDLLVVDHLSDSQSQRPDTHNQPLLYSETSDITFDPTTVDGCIFDQLYRLQPVALPADLCRLIAEYHGTSPFQACWGVEQFIDDHDLSSLTETTTIHVPGHVCGPARIEWDDGYVLDVPSGSMLKYPSRQINVHDCGSEINLTIHGQLTNITLKPFDEESLTKEALLWIDQWGNHSRLDNGGSQFQQCVSLLEVPAVTDTVLFQVTNLNQMFEGAFFF